MKNIFLLCIVSVMLLISCGKRSQNSDVKKVNDSTEEFTANGQTSTVTSEDYFANEEASRLNSEGIQLAEKGDWEGSRKKFEESSSLEPGNPTPLNNIGNTFLSEKNYNEAIVYYKKAISADSTYAKAYSNLGLAELRLDHYENSIANNNIGLRFAINPVNKGDLFFNNMMSYNYLKKEKEYKMARDSARFYFKEYRDMLDQIDDFIKQEGNFD